MKTLLFILFFTALSFPNGFGTFDSTGQTNREKEQIRNQEQAEKSNMGEFVDEKGTGERKQINERKKKDVFIDKDGDGICDTRQGGMSFNKLRKRAGQRHGSGGGGHNGGNGQGGGYQGGK